MKRVIALLLVVITYTFGFIDIQPQVIGEKKGMDGEVALSASYSSGNTEESSIGASAKGQYDAENWLSFVIAAYDYGKANGDKNSEEGLFHLRYIHSTDYEGYDWEIFTQTEFNPFQDLKNRSLVGAGLRKRVDKELNHYFDKLYIGLGVMYSYREPDIITDVDKILKRTKINSYITFKKTFNKNLSISYLGYYQPTIDDLSDFSSSQILQFVTPLADSINLSLDIIYKYNATPYSGIEKDDFDAALSLKYKF